MTLRHSLAGCATSLLLPALPLALLLGGPVGTPCSCSLALMASRRSCEGGAVRAGREYVRRSPNAGRPLGACCAKCLGSPARPRVPSLRPAR